MTFTPLQYGPDTALAFWYSRGQRAARKNRKLQIEYFTGHGIENEDRTIAYFQGYKEERLKLLLEKK